MAEAKAPIIVIKKKKAGHAGAHGGAWKVAYADFVTAMMAFFLVMWLLGSDDEVKQSVAHYFNHPSSALRPDLASEKALPLGDRTGAGDDVANGADGQVPEDLVERPARELQKDEPQSDPSSDSRGSSDIKNQTPTLDLNIETMKFSFPERVLFAQGTDELSPNAGKYLIKLSGVLKGFQGKVTVQTTWDSAHSYESSTTRVVAITQYLVNQKWIDETRIIPQVTEQKRGIASSPGESDRLIQFTLDR